MKDTTRQTAGGKVLMHFSMSLDGFVAGPGHAMDWMVEDATNRPGLLEEYFESTGACSAAATAGTETRRPAPTVAAGRDPSSSSRTTPRMLSQPGT